MEWAQLIVENEGGHLAKNLACSIFRVRHSCGIDRLRHRQMRWLRLR